MIEDEWIRLSNIQAINDASALLKCVCNNKALYKLIVDSYLYRLKLIESTITTDLKHSYNDVISKLKNI